MDPLNLSDTVIEFPTEDLEINEQGLKKKVTIADESH